MGNLVIDPLAIAALVGFGSLILMMVGLTVWMFILSGKSGSNTTDS